MVYRYLLPFGGLLFHFVELFPLLCSGLLCCLLGLTWWGPLSTVNLPHGLLHNRSQTWEAHLCPPSVKTHGDNEPCQQMMLLHPEVPSAVYLQGSLLTPDFFTSLRNWQALHTWKKGSLWVYIRGVSLDHGGLLPRHPVHKESVLRALKEVSYPHRAVLPGSLQTCYLMTLVGTLFLLSS